MLLFFKYEDEEKQTHLDPSSQVDWFFNKYLE